MSQTQINEVLLSPLTNARVAITDSLGHLTQSITTSTEISYVNGVTQSLQPLLNAIESGAAVALVAANSASTAASNAQATANNAQITANNAIPNSTGSVSASNLSAGSVSGSTANSGGSQGKVLQGTISSPDLRANAVTQFVQKTGDSGGNSVSGFTIIDTITITTLGGPILLNATVNIDFIQSGGAYVCTIAIWKGSNTTALPGAFTNVQIDGQSGGSETNGQHVQGSETPAAGSQTYHLGYLINVGNSPVVANYNFRALELRA
jgi:hypothetical protein